MSQHNVKLIYYLLVVVDLLPDVGMYVLFNMKFVMGRESNEWNQQLIYLSLYSPALG